MPAEGLMSQTDCLVVKFYEAVPLQERGLL
jgi:hypothetical protein